ncbi:hypothetical protein [Ensifer sp. Root31]|uniref:hypothetical protein n=1 Tax=Ensifer sp. Root31 TaxID=1736512 RepID=UPI000AC23650|nr:hypothetical protein [Ensifer sp. Root31]
MNTMINLLSLCIAGGLITSAIRKFLEGKDVTSAVRLGIGLYVLFLTATVIVP